MNEIPWVSADEVIDAYWLERPRWRWTEEAARKLAGDNEGLYVMLISWRM